MMRGWLAENLGGRFLLGGGLAVYETVLGGGRLQVYGFALCLCAPELAAGFSEIVRALSGNGGGRGRD